MYSVYEVMPEDTIESIADKYNITVDELSNLNSNLNSKYIIVPNNNNIFDMYIVKNNDNLYEIAQKYNITVDDLALINGIDKEDYIYPNQKIMIPSSNVSMYITKDSDTINTLTDYFRIPYDSLIKQNRNLYLLPDQLIVVKEESL